MTLNNGAAFFAGAAAMVIIPSVVGDVSGMVSRWCGRAQHAAHEFVADTQLVQEATGLMRQAEIAEVRLHRNILLVQRNMLLVLSLKLIADLVTLRHKLQDGGCASVGPCSSPQIANVPTNKRVRMCKRLADVRADLTNVNVEAFQHCVQQSRVYFTKWSALLDGLDQRHSPTSERRTCCHCKHKKSHVIKALQPSKATHTYI